MNPRQPGWKNKLYFGDNLDILRDDIGDNSVDLIYLDPPFNSNATYNVLFRETSGEKLAAQIRAFDDTWHWGLEAEAAYRDVVTNGPHRVSKLLPALRSFLGQNDVMAYVTFMAQRLVELHRVLKPTGSIYLHCDSTASHHLKLTLDALFDPETFRNEIIWQRTNARSTTGRWPRIHDVLLYYTKGNRFTYHPLQVKADKAKMPHTLITGSDGKKYQTYELTGPGITATGESGRSWRGFDPTTLGRHWADNVADREAWDAVGLIHWPKDGGWPRRLDEHPFDPDARMTTVGDVWTDIDRINQSARERLGYPTQKPEALLERIIRASSNDGDLILDPFAGCGTAIAVAERLHRPWIGIDITYLAIDLVVRRLKDTFNDELAAFTVEGKPEDLASARALAKRDPYQFQWWAVGEIDARPAQDKKKGADTGIDGTIVFFDDESGQAKKVIVQVKSGKKIGPTDIRDLKGVLDREKAQIGAFITLENATDKMHQEAISAGFYEVPLTGQHYPRLQILTVADLFAGKRVQHPRDVATFQRAQRRRKDGMSQPSLL